MTPAPLSGRRLALLGCLLAAAVSLPLSACGGGDRPAATTADPTGSRPALPSAAVDRRCQLQVGGLVKSLDRLRGSLAVGLSYEQYVAKVHAAKAAYAKIPVAKLTIGCLTATGTPGEKALNQYISAANAWGRCLAESGCDTAAIEAALQRRWRLASNHLASTRKGA